MNESSRPSPAHRIETSVKLCTHKEMWSQANAPSIADLLGYVCDESFCHILSLFIEEVITPARIITLSVTLAERYFNEAYRGGAPLTIAKKKKLPPFS